MRATPRAATDCSSASRRAASRSSAGPFAAAARGFTTDARYTPGRRPRSRIARSERASLRRSRGDVRSCMRAPISASGGGWPSPHASHGRPGGGGRRPPALPRPPGERGGNRAHRGPERQPVAAGLRPPPRPRRAPGPGTAPCAGAARVASSRTLGQERSTTGQAGLKTASRARLGIRRTHQPVPRAGLGHQVARAGRVGLDLLAQAGDVDVQVVRLDLVGGPPDPFQDGAVGEQLALVLGEQAAAARTRSASA